ncbi:MAG TPA: GT4 family glycosyltransferase PelF [Thermoanaerobaculia bacterium]|nr:GT4 family glycosyltransferase PelF [Thermoanaerobaculia bacterium]
MSEPSRLSVLLTTEGTYPHSSGGVSTWCDALIRNTPEVYYTLVPLMMNPHIELKYDPPHNARRVINVPLWGIEEPAEFLTDITFAGLHIRKRDTTDSIIEREFVPLFRDLLDVINHAGEDAAAFGRVLVAMENYFQGHDYNKTMKSRAVWFAFRESMEEHSHHITSANRFPGAAYQLPSLFDLTESLRWLYRFLMIVNVRVPRTTLTHSTAAAFCGIPCITAKIRNGTPMILTEHGVYVREQNLFLSRFHRLFFAKQFLLNLITAITRANYHYADIISPVCHFNTRWEVAQGAARDKIRVIYNGVDADRFIPAPREPNGQRVIATARIDPLKDIETFLRMAALVRQTNPRARFAIYGAIADRKYFDKCLSLRHELGLDDVVEMGVESQNIISTYHSADVIVLTSVSEAFPYSVLEAMSCAKAIVATDVGGVREALESNGVLVPPTDAEGLAREVRRLLDDPALRATLGARARAAIVEKFRVDHTIAKYLDLYSDLAERAA